MYEVRSSWMHYEGDEQKREESREKERERSRKSRSRVKESSSKLKTAFGMKRKGGVEGGMGKVSNSKDEHACRQEQKKKKERGGESTEKKRSRKSGGGFAAVEGGPFISEHSFFSPATPS